MRPEEPSRFRCAIAQRHVAAASCWRLGCNKSEASNACDFDRRKLLLLNMCNSQELQWSELHGEIVFTHGDQLQRDGLSSRLTGSVEQPHILPSGGRLSLVLVPRAGR